MDFDGFLKEAAPGLGLNWRKYRRRAARHGLEARFRTLGLAGFGEYLEYLRANSDEAAGLANFMLVTVSRFFRERGCWDELAAEVLPALAERAGDGVVRAWSAGSCGGEEPYTLAMLWLEHIAPRYPAGFAVTATDIDEASLARARDGVYAAGSLKEVPPGMLERYFTREGERWRVNQEVRGLVTFSRRDLMDGPPDGGFDLALCRYLAFTYYTGARLAEAARVLLSAVAPGGCLMAGRKEHIPEGLRDGLRVTQGCGCVYAALPTKPYRYSAAAAPPPGTSPGRTT